MSDLDSALVAGFGAGIYLFFKGFRVYRKYRVLGDIPLISIRSIPMGLVQVHGKAHGDQLVTSPVSNTPCLFYKVDIEKWKRNSKGGGSWVHHKTDANGVPFYLQDATGKVLVDARQAEYDLLQRARRQTGGGGLGAGLGRLLGLGHRGPTAALGPSDASLIAYAESVASTGGSTVLESLGQLALGRGLSLAGGSSPADNRHYRFSEYCILPGHWYDVTGTCTENPHSKDEHDRNLIRKGVNEPTFLISWRAEKEIERTLRNRAALHVFGGAALSVLCLGLLLNQLGWL